MQGRLHNSMSHSSTRSSSQHSEQAQLQQQHYDDTMVPLVYACAEVSSLRVGGRAYHYIYVCKCKVHLILIVYPNNLRTKCYVIPTVKKHEKIWPSCFTFFATGRKTTRPSTIRLDIIVVKEHERREERGRDNPKRGARSHNDGAAICMDKTSSTKYEEYGDSRRILPDLSCAT